MRPFRSTLRRSVASAAALALGLALSAGPAGAEPPAHAAAPGRDAAPATTTEDVDANDGQPDDLADDHDDAHPSGRDRSVEPGGSGNQGAASADPDDDQRGPDRTNGGADVPDGPGGEDLADQDGNNGCGNDDDFEDDNEGWCGRPGETTADDEVPEPPAGVDDVTEGDVDGLPNAGVTVPDAQVEADVVARTPQVAAVDSRRTVRPAAATAEVLGSVTRRQAAEPAGTLPRTGAGLLPLAAAGVAALAAGAAATRAGRRPGEH